MLLPALKYPTRSSNASRQDPLEQPQGHAPGRGRLQQRESRLRTPCPEPQSDPCSAARDLGAHLLVNSAGSGIHGLRVERERPERQFPETEYTPTEVAEPEFDSPPRKSSQYILIVLSPVYVGEKDTGTLMTSLRCTSLSSG